CALWVVPLSAVAFEQDVRFFGPPAAGFILRDSGALCGTPHVENGIHKRPSGFHAVGAIEECCVAAHAVVHERGIGATRGLAESFAIAEIHGDVADAHFRAGPLRSERNGDSFVRLNVENEAIRFHFFSAKNDVRRTLELNHDFGRALRKAFAGSEIKRHAGPAPIVDEHAHGDEGFGTGSRAYAWFLTISRKILAIDRTGGVLAANDRLRDAFEIVRTDRLENL